MRWVFVLALVGAAPAARADEADDLLARKMANLVQDFRLPQATRVEAARTLAKLGSRASVAVPDLVAVLGRLRGAEQEPLQEALVEALGQMGSAARVALPTLAQSTRRTIDLDLAIRDTTNAILNASDSQNVDVLAQQLSNRDVSLRVRAAKALGDIGPAARAAVPALTVALDTPDSDARRATIGAIRLIQPNVVPSEALVRAIAADLRDPDPNLRFSAAKTLSRIGPAAAAAAPDLIPLRTDPDPDVRRAASEAYARVTAPQP
ncbi:MAG: HEAT repeat domain-containing protein [Gemmata sp.]